MRKTLFSAMLFPSLLLSTQIASAIEVVAYVADQSTNTVTATIAVGTTPEELAVTPNGTEVYVANEGSNNVSVIDTSTNAVTATVDVGTTPVDVAITPDGADVYVSNSASNTVSVIDT